MFVKRFCQKRVLSADRYQYMYRCVMTRNAFLVLLIRRSHSQLSRLLHNQFTTSSATRMHRDANQARPSTKHLMPQKAPKTRTRKQLLAAKSRKTLSFVSARCSVSKPSITPRHKNNRCFERSMFSYNHGSYRDLVSTLEQQQVCRWSR